MLYQNDVIGIIACVTIRDFRSMVCALSCGTFPFAEDDMTDPCETLELGIACMDEEHRELTRLLDEFSRCIKERETEEARRVASQAILCANSHFEHEEWLAEQAHYPRIEEEKLQHRNLRLQFTTLVFDTTAGTCCDPVTLEDLDVMKKLLQEHISGPDKDLADYLKEAYARQPSLRDVNNPAW